MIARTYDYVDGAGDLVYQKVRLEPKSFRQRRPVGDRWAWGLTAGMYTLRPDGDLHKPDEKRGEVGDQPLPDTPRVLYRLPDLLASDPEDVVFYVEGEKDADRLAEAGLLATTAGSASDWRSEMATPLSGREVVIIPDNDPPGLKLARRVARDVASVAVRVRVVLLPGLGDGGDASDWLDAGHAVEELLVEVGKTPEWTDGPEHNGHEHNGKSNGTKTATKAVTWFDRRSVVKLIRARAGEPWVSVGLGNDTICRVRAGGLVTLAGPSGAGKTSLAAAFAARHARDSGWVLILSVELTADEIAARMIGQALGKTWEEVLTGGVPDDEMIEALPERLRIVDGEDATLTTLDAELEKLRAADASDSMILAMVDYGQIIAEENDDQRVRAINAWTRFDRILRKRRAVGLMLSQMSRANSKAARSGERLGADAMDGGAESAAIERYSTIVLEIGAQGQDDSHGRREMLLSVGKGRMGGADKVWPLQYTGATGHVIVVGVAKPAAEVRAEREAAVDDAKVGAAVRAMRDALGRAKKPISRSDLCGEASVNKTRGLVAIKRLLASGDAVEVERKAPRSKAWLLWTPGLANAAGVPVVVGDPGEEAADAP